MQQVYCFERKIRLASGDPLQQVKDEHETVLGSQIELLPSSKLASGDIFGGDNSVGVN